VKPARKCDHRRESGDVSESMVGVEEPASNLKCHGKDVCALSKARIARTLALPLRRRVMTHTKRQDERGLFEESRVVKAEQGSFNFQHDVEDHEH